MTGLESLLASLVRRELEAASGEIAKKVADEIAARQAAAGEPLQSLGAILSISDRAAVARLSRDPELRALGHRLGRSLRFRASEVRQLLAERQRTRCGASE